MQRHLSLCPFSKDITATSDTTFCQGIINSGSCCISNFGTTGPDFRPGEHLLFFPLSAFLFLFSLFFSSFLFYSFLFFFIKLSWIYHRYIGSMLMHCYNILFTVHASIRVIFMIELEVSKSNHFFTIVGSLQ